MNLPNKLTLSRILLVPLFLLLFVWNFPFHYLAAGLVFGIASFTDMLDGKIARARGLVTNLGKFMDPIADKMLTTAAFVGFLAIGKMSLWALMIILVREFVVTSVRLVAAEGGKVVAANYWGKFKTVAQYITIGYMLAVLEFCSWKDTVLAAVALPDAAYNVPLLIGQIFIWVATALTAISGFVYFWQNRSFFLEGER